MTSYQVRLASLGMVLGQMKDIESEDKTITLADLNLMYELKNSKPHPSSFNDSHFVILGYPDPFSNMKN